MFKQRIATGAVFAATFLITAACTTAPEPAPEPAGPVDPLDAFEKVGEPQREYTGTGVNDPDNLSSDIERLQDARREYNQAQDREDAEHLRSQAECWDSEDSRKVPIEDGSAEPAVYCEK